MINIKDVLKGSIYKDDKSILDVINGYKNISDINLIESIELSKTITAELEIEQIKRIFINANTIYSAGSKEDLFRMDSIDLNVIRKVGDGDFFCKNINNEMGCYLMIKGVLAEIIN